MIFNILFIIIATLVLYRNRISVFDQDTSEKQPEPTTNIYNQYLSFTVVSQCIINIITNLIGCSSNFGEAGYVILYTLITWISFVIIVSCRQYLRIPLANVFGYLWYYRALSRALKDENKCDELKKVVTGSGNNIDVFDESTSFIYDDYANKLIYIDALKDYITSEIPPVCSDIIKACRKRDVFGELILFWLAGIMCVFMAEYILSNNTCKNKPIPNTSVAK